MNSSVRALALLAATALLAGLAGCAAPPVEADGAEAAPGAPLAPPGQPNMQMRQALDRLASLGGEPVHLLAVPTAREQPTLADAQRALLLAAGRAATPEVVARVENHFIEGAEGQPMPVRLYWPAGEGPHPVLLYFHGGGWVLGDLERNDAAARSLANEAQAIVVVPHYRQAPEYRFPAAHDDAFAAYRWVLANAAAFGGDPKRVAVGGEGAGGNLAAATAIRARDLRVPMPVHQLLVYPITDVTLDTPSHRQHIDARPLGTPMLPWYFSQYLRSPIEGADPAFSVLRTKDLAGLPPATVITADIDPLRSQGRAYAERLRSDGVKVDYRNYEGVTHGFLGLSAVLQTARDAVAQAAMGLRTSFGTAR